MYRAFTTTRRSSVVQPRYTRCGECLVYQKGRSVHHNRRRWCRVTGEAVHAARTACRQIELKGGENSASELP